MLRLRRWYYCLNYGWCCFHNALKHTGHGQYVLLDMGFPNTYAAEDVRFIADSVDGAFKEAHETVRAEMEVTEYDSFTGSD